MFDAVRAAGLLAASGDADLGQLLSIDSTIVRAHQHAAGARKLAVVEEALPPCDGTGGSVELQQLAGRAS